MKLNKILAVAGLVALLGSGAFAKKAALKSSKLKASSAKTEILDWQGAEVGDDVPHWITTLNQGTTDNVAKELGIDPKQETIFIAQGRDADLEMAELWVKNIQAKQEIAASISQIIASEAEASMEAQSGTSMDSAEKTKLYKEATTMASAIELNGLKRVTQFWIQRGKLKLGKKKAKSAADYDTIDYTFFIVYKMSNDEFQRQIDSALRSVEDNTSEQAYLKKVLAAKVGQAIFPGNNVPVEFGGTED